jgi:hypothetical protein
VRISVKHLYEKMKLSSERERGKNVDRSLTFVSDELSEARLVIACNFHSFRMIRMRFS